MVKLADLLRGDEDSPDLAAAVHWYEMAAHAGDTEAMVTLGFLFAYELDPARPEGGPAMVAEGRRIV